MTALDGPEPVAYNRHADVVAFTSPPSGLEGLALSREAAELMTRAQEFGYRLGYAARSDTFRSAIYDLVATSADGLVAVVMVLGRHERGTLPPVLAPICVEVHLVGGAVLSQKSEAPVRDVLAAWANGFGDVTPAPAPLELVEQASRPICTFSAEEIARGLSVTEEVDGRPLDDVVSELACRRRHPSNLTRLLRAS